MRKNHWFAEIVIFVAYLIIKGGGHIMKHKMYLLLLIVAFIALPVMAQDEETGEVVYVDSVNTSTEMFRHPVASRSVLDEGGANDTIWSREKKFMAVVKDPYGYKSEGILHCIRMAMDCWESKLEITTPISITFMFNDLVSPDVEIKTTVLYSRGSARMSIPSSLYFQGQGIIREAGIIEINPYIAWDSSWAYDQGPYGYDNMTTALQRHIAHVLGFGTSVAIRDSRFNFAIQRMASAFDNMVTDGTKTLGSMALRGNSEEIEIFLKSELKLAVGGAEIPLYSSADGYVPYRTGCYFSLPTENIMNYPYDDRTKLFPISKETVEVLEAIGWNVKPHDISVSGTGLDATGYGSMFEQHSFTAVGSDGTPIANASWQFQLYNNALEKYETVDTGQGMTFSITASDIGDGYIDMFSCQQGRVVCDAMVAGAAVQCAYPIYLEARPYFRGYKIHNVVEADANYYTFDADLDYAGATGGYAAVCDNYGSCVNCGLGATIHSPRVYKYGPAMIELYLTNSYGVTVRALYVGTYDEVTSVKKRSAVANVFSIEELEDSQYDVYTLSGAKVNVEVGSRGTLPKGIYVLRNRQNNKSWKKCIVR